MNADSPAAIFRRVGWVLIAVGLLDIAIWAVCLARGLPYASGFNVFAVAAGVLLLRGSVTTAALVRWTMVFTLAGTVAMLLAAAVLTPPHLLWTLWHLHLAWSAAALAVTAALLLLFWWLCRELDRPAVRDALSAAGKRWSLRGAVAVGAGMMVLVGALFALLLNGDLASQAIARARAHAGPDHRYHVLMLGVSFDSRGIQVAGSVVAWNDTGIRVIPVRWQEP